MIDYNFEYRFREYNQKQTRFRIPIKMNLNNEQYKKEQLEFLRGLFPQGLNKKL